MSVADYYQFLNPHHIIITIIMVCTGGIPQMTSTSTLVDAVAWSMLGDPDFMQGINEGFKENRNLHQFCMCLNTPPPTTTHPPTFPSLHTLPSVFCRHSIENGVERGGSFAAYYKGELVVNLWGGFADEEARRPWKHNTASIFYSTTKSPSAIVMAHLVEK